MAVDKKGGGSGKARKRYAWMRIGYKSPAGGGKAHKGAPVYAWVMVGSDKYSMLKAKGNAVYAVRSRKSIPKTATVYGDPSWGKLKPGHPKGGPSLDGVRVGGTGPKVGTKKGDKAMNRQQRKNGVGGGGKRGRGVSSARARGQQQTQQAINQQLGSSKAGSRLGKGYADALAGQQFDAPIHDIKTLIERLGPQNQQAIGDLTKWFGDVGALNTRAGERSGQIAEDVAGRQDQAVQGLMAALGGGANDANAQIAQLQANDGGYQRVLGGIQEQYHNDMDPILAHAEASAKEREQRLNLTQMQDYQMQLADLLGQRGQAKASNQMEVDKYNNELAQQWFQNKLAKLNAALGAQAAGVDMQVKQAQLGQARQESKAAKNPSQNIWRKMNPAQRDELLQRATGAHVRPDGTMATQRSMKEAQAWLSGVLKNPVGSGKNAGLLTMLYQYYH
jgi:hypothetical protein